MLDQKAPPALEVTVIEEFRNALRGPLLLTGDTGYDEARAVWNAMIDRRPALIARCQGTADVVASIQFAREHGLPASIRGGGHNVSGKSVCDGGLMIDLSLMKGIRVDRATMTARAEPGVLWQELDHETQAFGLATTGGVVGTTGIAGLTLGGGQGWLAGKYGFTIDNLLSADVVTADGTLLRAGADENADLFWALRGAGHNFGIVTSFEYRLHPVSTVLGGMVIHPIDQARDVLRFYREFSAAVPDELTVFAGILSAPDGSVVVAMPACYAGDISEGERVLAPLRFFGSPVADTFAPMPYTAMQALMTGAFPYGRRNYWKSGLTSRISDEAIDIAVDFGRRVPSPYTAIVFGGYSGAYARVGRTETAYYHRDMQYDVVILSSWTDAEDDERNIGWTRELFQAIEPHLADRVYVNDLGDDAGERVRSAYGGNYEQLVELKTVYDPTNFFRFNQNIKPRT